MLSCMDVLPAQGVQPLKWCVEGERNGSTVSQADIKVQDTLGQQLQQRWWLHLVIFAQHHHGGQAQRRRGEGWNWLCVAGLDCVAAGKDCRARVCLSASAVWHGRLCACLCDFVTNTATAAAATAATAAVLQDGPDPARGRQAPLCAGEPAASTAALLPLVWQLHQLRPLQGLAAPSAAARAAPGSRQRVGHHISSQPPGVTTYMPGWPHHSAAVCCCKRHACHTRRRVSTGVAAHLCGRSEAMVVLSLRVCWGGRSTGVPGAPLWILSTHRPCFRSLACHSTHHVRAQCPLRMDMHTCVHTAHAHLPTAGVCPDLHSAPHHTTLPGFATLMFYSTTLLLLRALWKNE